MDGLTEALTTEPPNVGPGSPALAIHQHVASVHRYPGVVVVEKPDRPVERFMAEKRGTVWQAGIYPD